MLCILPFTNDCSNIWNKERAARGNGDVLSEAGGGRKIVAGNAAESPWIAPGSMRHSRAYPVIGNFMAAGGRDRAEES
jgi:hypothetical protein